MSELSATMRAYLAEIYRLSESARVTAGEPTTDAGAYVSTSALADVLDVSAPAVNRMVSRLREADLLEHEPYQGIRLTPQGEQEARKELRRHRIAEAFLVKVMGFGWHEVHEEAQNLTGAMSNRIADRMLQMSNYPTRCPHGEPIPDPEGNLPPDDDILLVDAAEGNFFEITRVRTRERDRLEYLTALGLLPGAHLEVIHAAPFNGPLQLKLNKEYRIIGHNLAEMICVKPIER